MSSSTSVASIPPIGHAVGGAIGSALALLLFYPLERARIEMQASSTLAVDIDGSSTDESQQHLVSPSESSSSSEESWVSCVDAACDNGNQESLVVNNEIIVDLPTSSHTRRQEGLGPTLCRLYKSKELYQGAGSVVITLATSSFVFFYAHQLIQGMLAKEHDKGKRTKKSSSALISLFGSSLAGAINVLITNPMWVANLRIIKGAKASVWREMHTIVKSEGWKSLWNGTGTSLLLVSNPVLQFFCYEQLKASRLQKNNSGRSTLSPIEAFCVGALAKAVATIATYPLQLAQVLLRLENTGTGTWDCLKNQFDRGGVKALYTGMNAKLLQTVLTAAFTFLTYEQILRVVRATIEMTAQKKQRLSSSASSGLSNAI